MPNQPADLIGPFREFVVASDDVLLAKAKNQLLKLEQAYGENHPKSQIIGRLASVLKDQTLNYLSTNHTFIELSWWTRIGMANAPRHVVDKFTEHQIIHLKFYFFLNVMSTIEAVFRILVRNLYPGSCRDGKDAFFNIYTFLLNRLNIRVKHEETFNIARVIRNTVHNMGVHTDDSISLQFNGVRYQFNQWAEINFFTLEFNLEFQSKLIDALIDVTDSREFHSANF